MHLANNMDLEGKGALFGRDGQFPYLASKGRMRRLETSNCGDTCPYLGSIMAKPPNLSCLGATRRKGKIKRNSTVAMAPSMSNASCPPVSNPFEPQIDQLDGRFSIGIADFVLCACLACLLGSTLTHGTKLSAGRHHHFCRPAVLLNQDRRMVLGHGSASTQSGQDFCFFLRPCLIFLEKTTLSRRRPQINLEKLSRNTSRHNY